MAETGTAAIAVHLRGVSKYFPGVVALRNVSLDFAPARCMASSARMGPANPPSSRLSLAPMVATKASSSCSAAALPTPTRAHIRRQASELSTRKGRLFPNLLLRRMSF